jgi:hypothetical protein
MSSTQGDNWDANNQTVLEWLSSLSSRILDCEFDGRGSPQGFQHSMGYIGLGYPET